MNFQEKISSDLKTAMKAKEESRITCLRMLKTALKNKQVEKGENLKEEEIQAVISSLVRKAKEAADEFRKGNREDLALKEENELKILYEYLPEQLDHSEIEKVLKKIISEESASGPKDMGKVMKAAMARMAGKAGGKQVSEIARKLLSQPE